MMDQQPTRRRVIQGAGIVGLTGVVGGSVVTAQGTPTAQDGGAALRIAHVSPDGPDVDVRINDEAVIEGLSFGDVSSYQTVEPGTAQVQVVAADGGILGGVLDDLFGQDNGDTVLFEAEVSIEEGTTSTAVAFGRVSEGGPSDGATPTPGEETPAEETPTEETPAEETPEDGMAGDGREFQVQILEDDISSPGEERSRVRAFHAVPDADDVDIIAVPQGQGGQGQGQPDGTPEGTPGDGQGQGQGPPNVDVTLEGGTVYSGFATGFLDPEAAAQDGTEETPTDGGETAQDVSDAEFEFIVVQTSQDGKRVDDGGTGGL